jgi:hypothetical protein
MIFVNNNTGNATVDFASVSGALNQASSEVGFNNQRITNLANPTGSQDATTRIWVENLVNTISGGGVTFSGVSGALNTANTNVGFNNVRIINVSNPTGSQDVATKVYTDVSITSVSSSVASDINTQSSRTTTLSGVVATDVNTLSGRITTNTNSITTLSGVVATDVVSLSGRITALSGVTATDINTVKSNITTNTNSITTLSGVVATDIITQTNRITTLSGVVALDVTALGTRITTLSGVVSTDINTQSTRTTTLSGVVATDVNSLRTSIQNISGGSGLPTIGALRNWTAANFYSTIDFTSGASDWTIYILARAVRASRQTLIASTRLAFKIDQDTNDRLFRVRVANAANTDDNQTAYSDPLHGRFNLYTISRRNNAGDLAWTIGINGSRWEYSAAGNGGAYTPASVIYFGTSDGGEPASGSDISSIAAVVGTFVDPLADLNILDLAMTNGKLVQTGSLFTHLWNLNGSAPGTQWVDSISGVTATLSGSALNYISAQPRW